MDPKNTSQRKNAFFKFLLYYAVSLAAIGAVIYFGMRIPAEEAQHLKDQLAVLEKEKNGATEFLNGVNETKLLLDSVERAAGAVARNLEGELSNKILELKSNVKSDDAQSKNYQAVIALLYSCQEAQHKVKEADSKDINLSASQSEMTQLRTDLNDCNQRYNELVISINKK